MRVLALRSIRRLLVVLVAVTAACEGGSGGTEPGHLVLITLDTLRADHLGCYGYPRATSPFLDRLAGEGVLFTHAYAAMSTTLPSHVSLFTSLYPLQHGVLANSHRLDDSFVTLAETLRDAGFLTAGFVSSYVHFRPGNAAQGFVEFDEPAAGPWKYRPARATVDRAIAWLRRQSPGGRIFLWVHLFDPHRPYDPRNRMAVSDGAEGESLLRFLIEEHALDPGFFAGEELLLALMEQYDGEIRAADRALERLYAAFTSSPLHDRSTWIITADHGEGLGNHRWFRHGKHIYNEQIRVPLIFHFAPARGGARRVASVVEHVDLAPTVLDLLGLPRDALPRMEGRSLVPVLTGGDEREEGRFAFAQRTHYAKERPTAPRAGELNWEAGSKFAVVDARFKYILRTAGSDELYDLRNDPYETDDLIGRGLAEEEAYRQILLSEVARLEKDSWREPSLVDPETLQRLESLGYAP